MSLGSIVVRLSMNTADFETDAGRAAKIADRRAKEIDAAFRKAGTAIGLALGAGLIAATAKIKSTINNMDDLSKAAQRVGLPTEEFSRMAYAGSLADVEMETLVSTLGKLTKAQAASLKESSEQAKVFDALGISAKNADGSLRSSTDVLLDFADVFASLDGSPEAMAAGFALFGRSFQDMIPLIKDGSGAMREMFEESDALGKTLSTETGKAAEEFNDNLTRLQTGVNGVWMEIASGMLPKLNAMTGDMVVAAKQTDSLRDFGEGLVTVLGALGTGFSFVAGMTRQFTTDALASADALLGYAEAARNISSLGLASGTVSGGLSRADNAWNTRRGLMADIAAQRQRAEAQADIDRMLRNGVKYDGPLLEDGSQGRRESADAIARRLRGALATTGGGKSGGKPKAAELTEEQKAAKALNEEYARTAEGLRERLGLMGLETEAAKMKWETEEGSFKALDPLRKAELIAQAGLVDAKKVALDLDEKQRRAAEEALESYDRVIADIQMERDTLGMTNEQMEIYNRLKWAGVDANSEFGRSIIEQSEDLQRSRKAMDQQIEGMDAARDSFKGFLSDVWAGKNAWDALSDALDNFINKLADAAMNDWVDQLLGKSGSSQTGSAGGGLWGMLGSFFGGGYSASSGGVSGADFASVFDGFMGGGGWARGGFTGPGGMNEIAGPVHRGEVVWSKGDIARAGGVAAVEAMRRGSGRRSGGDTFVINNSIRGDVTARTSDQLAGKLESRLRRQRRNA